MSTITIAPLSTPKTLTVAAWNAILGSGKLFLQTVEHPSAAPVLQAGVSFVSMDDLYESAEDFDALNTAIARRLIEAGDCTYAVMGDGCFAQTEAILEAAKKHGAEVVVLSGVSYGKAAFPMVQEGVFCTARTMPREPDLSVPLCVQEIDSMLAASEVKLWLSEFYPDEHTVQLATMQADGSYQTETLQLYTLDRNRSFFAGSVLLVPPVAFSEQTRYGFSALVSVMERLRAPDGCPWDAEQTHESLKKDLIEESYELCDAIDEADDAHMTEELGDVLLQVVFHACIAKEQGRFDIRDVADGIVKKLIYRHPHIFGDVTVQDSEEVLKNWDALKQKEKGQTTAAEVLCAVPKRFPALMRSHKIQHKARKVGFDWDSAGQALSKVEEELAELRAAMAGDGNVEEEAGDLLFALVNVTRLLGLDAETLLHAASDKFVRRFGRMEELARADGHPIETLPLKEQDAYWDRAKLEEQAKNLSIRA